MLRLFGQKKPKTDPNITILNLQSTIDLLHKRQKYLEVKIKREISVAKANGQTNKRLAIRALKRKRLYEEQIDTLDGSIFNLEQQRIAIESAITNKEVLGAMKEGSNALKGLQDNMTVDDVEDITDDIKEQLEVANEIGQAISQDVGSGLFDDEELEKELLMLELEDLEAPVSDLPKPSKKSNIPITNEEHYKKKDLEDPI